MNGRFFAEGIPSLNWKQKVYCCTQATKEKYDTKTDTPSQQSFFLYCLMSLNVIMAGNTVKAEHKTFNSYLFSSVQIWLISMVSMLNWCILGLTLTVKALSIIIVCPNILESVCFVHTTALIGKF